MKVILVNERLGHTRTYVIRGWLKGVLSLCLLGAPVALGYLGYQLSLQAGSGEVMPLDAAVEQVQRGLGQPADVQFSGQLSGHSARTSFTLPWRSSPDSAAAPEDGRAALLTHRLQQRAVSLHRPARRSPHQFRHGRSVDPASYQRRVYS